MRQIPRGGAVRAGVTERAARREHADISRLEETVGSELGHGQIRHLVVAARHVVAAHPHLAAAGARGAVDVRRVSGHVRVAVGVLDLRL